MLRNQAGIHSVKVALLAERGVVEYDPAKWTPEKVIEVSIFLLGRVVQLEHRRYYPRS